MGAGLAAVNHFVLDFTFGKQNLEGAQVDLLAERTGRLYRRLAEGARRFQALLGGWQDVFQTGSSLPDKTIRSRRTSAPFASDGIGLTC